MRTLIASLALCLAGCGHDGNWWAYTKSRPNPADLVGVYVPDQATLDLIAREGRYAQRPASITLGADGSLEITNIPDWWLTDFGHPMGGFDTGHGKWELYVHQRWWALDLDFPSTEQFESLHHRPTRFVTSFMLVGQRPPYKILIHVGDPDGGRVMLFEKAASQGK